MQSTVQKPSRLFLFKSHKRCTFINTTSPNVINKSLKGIVQPDQICIREAPFDRPTIFSSNKSAPANRKKGFYVQTVCRRSRRAFSYEAAQNFQIIKIKFKNQNIQRLISLSSPFQWHHSHAGQSLIIIIKTKLLCYY